MYKGLTTIIFTILLVINSSYALYKDQAGVIDWYQALVGTPKISYFQKIIGRSNLIVATEHNVIANLNLRASTINWRHAFKDDDKLITIAPLDNFIISLSESKSSNIRIWNGQNGYLVSEYIVENVGNENIENGDLLVQNNVIYALIHGNSIIKINNVSRSQEGKFKLNNNNYSKLFYNKKTNEIIVIGKNNDDKLIVTVLESNGKTVSENVISNVKFETSDIFFTGEFLVIKDINGILYTLDPSSNSARDLSSENVNELVHVKDNNFVIKTADNKNTLVKITNTIEKLTAFENNDEGIISVFTNDNDTFISKTTVTKKDISVVEVINVNTGKITKAFEIKNDYSNYGEITNVSLDSYRKKDGTLLYRIFTTTQDGSIHLYKENNLVWDREESLSDVADLKFIALPEISKDIPEAIIDSANSGILAQVSSRIQYQLSFLKV